MSTSHSLESAHCDEGLPPIPLARPSPFRVHEERAVSDEPLACWGMTRQLTIGRGGSVRSEDDEALGRVDRVGEVIEERPTQQPDLQHRIDGR